MNIEDLKSWMSSYFDQLGRKVDALDSSLRSIELNTTKSIAEMRKDIEDLEQRVEDIEKFSNLEKLEATMQAADMGLTNRVKAVEDSQKFKWEEIYRQRQVEALAFQKYQSDVAASIKVLTDSYGLITKLLWTIVVILLGYGIPKLIDWIGSLMSSN